MVKPVIDPLGVPVTTTPLPHAPTRWSPQVPFGVPPFVWNPTIDPPKVKFAVPTLLPFPVLPILSPSPEEYPRVPSSDTAPKAVTD